MMRWNQKAFRQEPNSAKVAEFISELQALCRRFNLSIAHEDTGGGFIIREFNDHDEKWLSDAADKT